MGKDTVFANGRSVATKGTDHVAVNAEEWDELLLPTLKQEATMNVAYMPSLQNGSVRTFFKGRSVWHVEGYLSKSEEYPVEPPGTRGKNSGVAYRGIATCIAGSPDVFVEGKSVVRHFDSTKQDSSNSLGVVLLRSDLARLKAALDEERRRRAAGLSKAPDRKGRAAPRMGPKYDEKRLLASQEDQAKAERLERRRALIRAGRAKAAEYPEGSRERRLLSNAADRLERNNTSVQMAELSENVYKDSGAPPGWERIETHSNPVTGYYAAVYRSTIDPPQTVLAYRGTGGLKAANDWIANIRQKNGARTFQYGAAARDARDIASRYPDLVITGHSLGGGLASLGSAVTGKRAYTYNAAGLHTRTAGRYGVDIRQPSVAGRIDAYNLYGEVLTSVQESAVAEFLVGDIPDALGNKITLFPSTAEGLNPDTSAIRKHDIDLVKAEIESQKTSDQRALGSIGGLVEPVVHK